MYEIFNRLFRDTKTEFLKVLFNNIKNKKRQFIITANPEIFMKSKKDEEIKKMFFANDVYCVADGIAIVKSAHYLGINVKERITGIDLTYDLLKYANTNRKSVYLFGAKKEVLIKLKKVIKKDYPNLILLGSSDGYIENKDEEMNRISKLSPDILIVALGVPAQEKLIYKHMNKFKNSTLIGVGGSFDVISGMKKRAPKIFIKTNTEWLYRICMEPKRLKRFWDSNIKFIFEIKKERRNKI